MQKSNGGKAADERFLFHGTSKKYIDAICQQNFDWRICGLHGTVYGKGYFFGFFINLLKILSSCCRGVKLERGHSASLGLISIMLWTM